MNLYELFIGFRYLKSKKSQGFISFNTVLSIFIVFIGVFILILVTSVMSGFQSQIKDKILDVDSHFTVNGYNGENFDEGITNYNEVAEIVKKNKQVVSAMPYFQGQGLLRYKSKISPVLVRGLGDKNNIPMDFKKFIIDGEYKFSGAKEIYIGDEMGYNERIKIGDVVELIVPKGKFSATEGMQPGIDKFKVIGFFKTGFYDFDTTMIIMSLPKVFQYWRQGLGNRCKG